MDRCLGSHGRVLWWHAMTCVIFHVCVTLAVGVDDVLPQWSVAFALGMYVCMIRKKKWSQKRYPAAPVTSQK